MDSKRALPEFIQKRKDQRRREVASSVDREDRLPERDSMIQLQSKGFWKVLVKELEFTVSTLHEIDVTGSISPFGEEIVRVSLNDNSAQPLSTRTDLILDGDRIRCSVADGGIYYLNFTAVSDTEIAVRDIQREGDSMDALKTAEYVVDRMLNILEWTRR